MFENITKLTGLIIIGSVIAALDIVLTVLLIKAVW